MMLHADPLLSDPALFALDAHYDFAVQLFCEDSNGAAKTDLASRRGHRKTARGRRRPKGPLEPEVSFAETLYHQLNASRSRLMSWNVRGNGFLVVDADEFARRELPLLFKHKSFARFARDLRAHGFRGMTLSNSASMIRSFEFRHPNFVRGHASQLKRVTPRARVEESVQHSASPTDQSTAPFSMENVPLGTHISLAPSTVDHVELASALDVESLKSEITELSGEVQQTQTLLDQLLGSLLLPASTVTSGYTAAPVAPFGVHDAATWMSSASTEVLPADDQLLSLFAEPLMQDDQ
ncbi:hypothetical protein P43SY_002640 [Pythium insidiosum]|uniref:HSF-type DNA-binding domain-containing protein n=1 Tax=Pythium insidiosum TaxID=114742 RepID=A0AAD5MJQ3_PYTIN|nr:hypothetical protein P43SY_002640 [Pythium insidiosum]